MTQEQFRAKITEMVKRDGGIQAQIINSCIATIAPKYMQERHLNAADDDFILPKQVLCAVLQEMAWQYEPITAAGKKIVKEIRPLVNLC